MTPAVQRLDPRASAELEDGVGVLSFPAAVEDCVLNALQAGATCIRVEVDPSSLSFCVEDDGTGMNEAALDALREAGSHSATEGFLARVARVANLRIVTKSAGGFETVELVQQGPGRARFGPAREDRAGTLVIVKDLWFNTPVRRSQALARAPHHVARVGRSIIQLAAGHPGVDFRLIDAQRRRQTLHVKGGRTRGQMLQWLLGEDADCVEHFDVHLGWGSVSGDVLVPPRGGVSRESQVVLVNGRPVEADIVTECLHAAFRDVVAELVERRAACEDAADPAFRMPAYFIQITWPPDRYVAFRDADAVKVEFDDCQTLARALKEGLLRAWAPVATLAMIEEGRQMGLGLASCAPTTQPTGGPSMVEWLRTALGGADPGQEEVELVMSGRSASGGKRPGAGVSHRPLKIGMDAAPRAHGSGRRRSERIPQERPSGHVQSSALSSWAPQACPGAGDDASQPRATPPKSDADRGADDAGAEARPPAVVLEDRLWDRDNAAGAMVDGTGVEDMVGDAHKGDPLGGQREAPSVPFPLSSLLERWDRAQAQAAQPRIISATELASQAGMVGGLAGQPVGPESLARAVVLDQVDNKFLPIVCSDRSSGAVLCFVDQHAADERVQLEELQARTVGPGGAPRAVSSRALPNPQTLSLTPTERAMLDLYR